jgi:hypothetical protein
MYLRGTRRETLEEEKPLRAVAILSEQGKPCQRGCTNCKPGTLPELQLVKLSDDGRDTIRSVMPGCHPHVEEHAWNRDGPASIYHNLVAAGRTSCYKK